MILATDPDRAGSFRFSTAARGFDGYKGHVAIDPDSEVIRVTPGNAADGAAAEALLRGVMPSSSQKSRR